MTVKCLAIISFVELVYNSVIVLAMHKLKPAYNPRSRYISEYVLTKYGRLVKSGFLAYGLAVLGVCLSMWVVLPFGAGFTVGITFLAVSGISKILMSIFNADLKLSKMSLHGIIHTIAYGVGIVSYIIGLILLSFNFAHDKSSQALTFITQMTALTELILVVFIGAGFLGDLALKYRHNTSGILARLSGQIGVCERLQLGITTIYLVVIVVWIVNR